MPKKLLILVAWMLTAIAAVAAVVRAYQEKSSTLCQGVNVTILGDNTHVFVEEKEIYKLLNRIGLVRGQQMGSIHLRSMEKMLETNPWIQQAELFFDAERFLQVHIVEREPLARVFTVDGNSFYIDTGMVRLPLSNKLSARVPVFTGFPSGKPVLSSPDSAVLADLRNIARFVVADSFWNAQIGQIDVLPNRSYELVPLVGNHLVALGNADSLEGKFQRLYSFYKAAWQGGYFEKYERLDLRYAGQVVAVKRGSAPVLADTSAAMQNLLRNGLIHNGEIVDTLSKVTQHSNMPIVNFDSVASRPARPAKSNIQQPKPALPKRSNPLPARVSAARSPTTTQRTANPRTP